IKQCGARSFPQPGTSAVTGTSHLATKPPGELKSQGLLSLERLQKVAARGKTGFDPKAAVSPDCYIVRPYGRTSVSSDPEPRKYERYSAARSGCIRTPHRVGSR